jgi:uncharacterized repeat protein (TIGR03803 family)
MTLRFTLLAALAIVAPPPGVAQTTTYEVLHSFTGKPDGAQPNAALVIGKDGALYGTSYTGVSSELGTIFRLAPTAGVPWNETVLHNFTGPPEGQYPTAALVSEAGSFYGATKFGGTGAGTIFELAPPATAEGTWTETVLYSFVYSKDSQNVAPIGPVLIAPGGTIFTTTEGAPDVPLGLRFGAVIALVPPTAPGGDWAEYEISPFGGPPQGEWPFAGVVSKGGSLFGTTAYGGDEYCDGPEGCGTVYELTPPATQGNPWTQTIIHTFGVSPNDGADPEALTVGPGGVLYGATQAGGSGSACEAGEPGCGTVFQLTPPSAQGGTWTYSVIYSFTGLNGDGAAPPAGVVVGKNGSLYGTTQYGGSATTACPGSYYIYPGCGIVFELTPPATPGGTWTEKVLHSFSDANGDGSMPVAALAVGSTGVLYGTTSAGGTAGKGTVFAIAP